MKKITKNVLKIIFPLVLLKRVQLEINKVRIKTIDRFRFAEQQIHQEEFVIRRDDYPFRIYSIKTAHLEPRLRWQFEQDNKNWTQNEYLLIYSDPCIIEPRYGWAISSENKLIYPSLGYSRVSYLPKPAGKIKTLRNTSLEEYSQLVSLRDTGEENYYHFYNDVLAKLFFLENNVNLSPEVPLLISKRLFDRPFFQYFLTHPYLRDRQWVVQDEQYIRSHLTYFCKPLTHTAQYYSRIIEMVHPKDWHGISAMSRRLFITRSPKRLRFIENNVEIVAVCQDLGFEIVDFDDYRFLSKFKR
jgi:Glycosyltransferase 61